MSKNPQKPEGELAPQKIYTEFGKEVYEFPQEVNLLLKVINQVPADEPFKKPVVEDLNKGTFNDEELALVQQRIQKSIDSILEQELFSNPSLLISRNTDDYINYDVDTTGASSHTNPHADYSTQ